MPRTKRAKPLYQRGAFKLYRRDDRDNLEIVWYDDERKRERSRSAGTGDVAEARAALDRQYLTETKGDAFCPTCGKPRDAGGVLVTTAIADYLTTKDESPSINAMRSRLNHVFSYLAASGQMAVRCDQIDETWIKKFRAWAASQPIVAPSGKKRQRTLSTIENSVLQLAAAINANGGIRALFKPIPSTQVNRTPQHRSDVAELIAMFRYCLYPNSPTPKMRERHLRERANLLTFLRLTVTTWARPDAALDASLDPKRRQWNSAARIFDLNPYGRLQTRKHRASVPVAHQMAAILDAAPKGPLIRVASIKSAWNAMAIELKLPGEGEAGTKLVRRSMANIVRSRLPQEAWGEVEIMLGHSRFDAVSDLYAPFRPDYLRRVLAEIESVCDEIEAGCAGAFYRVDTANQGNVFSLGAAKNG